MENNNFLNIENESISDEINKEQIEINKNGYNFDFESWKDNCFQLHECAGVICKFLDIYLLSMDKIHIELGISNEYPSLDYYMYLHLYHWLEKLRENHNEGDNLSDFEENIDKFNLIYQKNLKMYQSIDAENKVKLTYERLTKHNINMYQTDKDDYGVSGVEKHTELFSKIDNLIDIINKTIYITDILDDVGYMYNDAYMFIPGCEKPLTIEEFETVENKPVKKLKNHTTDIEPTVKSTIVDYYNVIFDYNNIFKFYHRRECREIRRYFKTLTNDFEIFINEELIKMAKTNYLSSKNL